MKKCRCGHLQDSHAEGGCCFRHRCLFKLWTFHVCLCLEYKPKYAFRISISKKRLWKKQLYKKNSGACAYCGSHFEIEKLSFDHIVPKSKGGSNEFKNLILACLKCNSIKGDKDIVPPKKFNFGSQFGNRLDAFLRP